MNSPFPPSACSHAGMSSGAGAENEPPGADVVVDDAADGPPFVEHATRLYVASAAATPPALRRKARRSTPARRAARSPASTISARTRASCAFAGRGRNSPFDTGPGGRGNGDAGDRTTPE